MRETRIMTQYLDKVQCLNLLRTQNVRLRYM